MVTAWEKGQRVEARHPTFHPNWGMGTVEAQYDYYVRVKFDDGLRAPNGDYLSDNAIPTYHLNVREPLNQ